jgi:zinc protease
VTPSIKSTEPYPTNTEQTARSSNIVIHQLSNGFKIFLVPDRRAPVAVLQLWVNVGSSDEPFGKTGLSHALEHAMFKGTQQHPKGEYSRLVNSFGGQFNAFTTRDFTVYHQQIPKEFLLPALALEADRLMNIQIEASEFDKEMNVIREERRMRTEDVPAAKFGEQLNALVYLNHPLRNPVIGWMDDLDALQATDANQWFKTYYAPNNTVLVIVGDIDTKELLPNIEKAFSTWKRQIIKRTRILQEEPQLGQRRTQISLPRAQRQVSIDIKLQALMDLNASSESDQLAYAADVLSELLTGYEGARLTRRLVNPSTDQALAPSAIAVSSSFDNLFKHRKFADGTFNISAIPVPGVSDEALEALIWQEIRRVADEGVNERELQRIKNQSMASRVFERDSIFYRAYKIGFFVTLGLNHNADEIIDQKLQAVSAEQIQAVSRLLLDSKRQTIGWLYPAETEATTPTASISSSASKPQ